MCAFISQLIGVWPDEEASREQLMHMKQGQTSDIIFQQQKVFR